MSYPLFYIYVQPTKSALQFALLYRCSNQCFLDYSLTVIFVNVFLAIAVDKLSEINAVKEDMTLRTEQQEEKRKERKEQLDALKNPTRPQKLRQTLQRVFLFTSSVRANSDAQQRKKTPRRVRSLINVPMDKPYVQFQRRKLSSVVSYQSSDIHSPIASSEGTEQSTTQMRNINRKMV